MEQPIGAEEEDRGRDAARRIGAGSIALPGGGWPRGCEPHRCRRCHLTCISRARIPHPTPRLCGQDGMGWRPGQALPLLHRLRHSAQQSSLAAQPPRGSSTLSRAISTTPRPPGLAARRPCRGGARCSDTRCSQAGDRVVSWLMRLCGTVHPPPGLLPPWWPMPSSLLTARSHRLDPRLYLLAFRRAAPYAAFLADRGVALPPSSIPARGEGE